MDLNLLKCSSSHVIMHKYRAGMIPFSASYDARVSSRSQTFTHPVEPKPLTDCC